MPESTMLHVLGQTRLTPTVPLTSMQQTILAAIAFHHPRAVGVADLAEQVWPHRAPATARAALQNQISRLRSVISAAILETTKDGYRWTGQLDLVRLVESVQVSEAHLASGHAQAAFEVADLILSEVSGEAFGDLPESSAVLAARESVHQRRYGLENIRLSAALGLARPQWAVMEAERLVQQAPYDEHRHSLYASALAAVGRHAEALRVIASFRRRMRDDLGLNATAVLADTEQRILHGGTEPTLTSRAGTLVGREPELAMLLDHIADGRNVVVRGEPGTGVSSLLSMLTARAPQQQWKVVRVRHTPMFDAAPLEVLSEILTVLNAPHVEPWRMLSRFTALVDEARRGARLLLIVDDADLLGPSTRYALEEVSRTPEIVLVTGTHAPSPSKNEAVTVALEGLGPDEIAELLTDTYHLTISAEYVRQLHRATAGNPLLLHALISDGHDDMSEAGTRSGQVRDVVQTRLARLSPAARSALDWLAVSDGTISPDLLAGTHPALTALGDEDPELIVTLTMTFRHTAVRDMVYHDIAEAHRAELHHALADLASRHHLASGIVAHHALAATALDPEAARDAAVSAAQDATRIGAHLDAAAVLSRAIDTLPVTLPGHLDLRIAHGDALRLAGDPAHLETLHQAAADALHQQRAASLAAAMFALLQLGATSIAGHTDDHTQTLTARALAMLKEPEHVAIVCGAASLAQSMSGQATEALASFRRAEQLATSQQTRAAVLPFAYLALGHPDHADRRVPLTEELITGGRTTNNPHALWEGLHQRFSHDMLHGNRASMQASHDEMVSLMPHLGDVGRAWSIRYQEAAIAHLDGHDDQAEHLAFDAYHIFSPVSESRASAALYGQILGIRLTQNRTNELADALRDMIAGQPSVPAWHAALAHATALSNADEARTHLELALDRAQHDFTWLATHVVGARAAALLGDPDLAARYLHALIPYSGLTAWQGTCTYGPVDTALALAAVASDDPRATTFATRARAGAERLGSPQYSAEANDLDQVSTGAGATTTAAATLREGHGDPS